MSAVEAAAAPAVARKPGYRSALAHRDFAWIVAGLAVSNSGSWAYNVALAVYVFERTGSPAWVAAVSIGRFVPALLLGPYAGVVAERLERRQLMLFADLLMGLWVTLLAVVVILDGPILLAIAFAALTTATDTTYYPAVSAMTPQIVGEDDLAAANAITSALENGSVIVGPAIGAGVLLLGPPWVAILLNAATFFFSALCVAKVRERSHPVDVTEEGEASVLRQVTVGFRAIASSTTATLLIGFSVIASFFYGTDTVLFLVLSQERLGTGAEGYGYLLAALGVGGLLAAGAVNRLSSYPRLGRIITIGMVVYVLPTAAMVLVDDPAVAFVLQVVRGAGTLVVDVLAVTAIQRMLAPELMARVFGVYMSLVIGAIALGAVVTPPLLDLFGLDTTLLVYGLGATTVALLAYPFLARPDREAAERLAELTPRITALEGIGMLSGASRTAIERLAASADEVDVPEGAVVIEEGDPADAMYVILAGAVEVHAKHHRQRRRKMATLATGDLFGEIGLLERIPRTATVRAATACRLLRIDGEEFLEALSVSQAPPSLLEGALNRLTASAPSYQPAGALASHP